MKSKTKLMRRLAAALFFVAGATGAQVPTGTQSNAPSSASPDCADLPVLNERLERANKILHDWPNLARYAEANATLAAPTKFELRVVFMGDSITDAWISPEFGGFFPGKPYVDRGISGQTTPQMLIRLRPDVIALQPKVVVILAGTNDIAGNTGPMTDEQIEGNLASMAELAAANGIKVVLSSITPVSNYHVATPTAVPQTTSRPLARVRAINDWMREYAAAHQHQYVDYFSAMVDEAGLLRP